MPILGYPASVWENAPQGGERAERLDVLCDAIEDIGRTPDDMVSAVINDGGEHNIAVLNARKEINAPHAAAANALRDARDAVRRDVGIAQASGKALVDLDVDVPDTDMGDLVERIHDNTITQQEVREARPPIEVQIADFHAQCDALAAQGAPWASVDLEARGSEKHARAKLHSATNLHSPRLTLNAAPLHEGGELGTVFNGEAAFMWLCEEIAKSGGVNYAKTKGERDLEAADAAYSGLRLTDGEIRDRLRELEQARIALQRVAAAAVWRALDAGDMSVSFPPGMNGLAVIGVEARAGERRKVVPYDDLRHV